MELDLRPAVPPDFAVLRAIAAEGGSPDGDDRYFAFVGSTGRLIVATLDGQVIGFAGAVPVRSAVMVTDLFVDPSHRSVGAGRRLLHAVLDDQSARLTFSSTHPAALRLYAEFGLVAGERLLTLEGAGVGDGAPLAAGRWQHDRPELVDHFSRSGATVTAHSVTRRVADAVEVWRVDGDEPQRALADVVGATPSGNSITVSVLESDPLAAWLARQGFREVDHDVFCRSADMPRSVVVACVHRGLC